MQCSQCKVTGFRELDDEGLCPSCAKAKAESSGKFRGVYRTAEWLAVLAWESTLPDYHSNYVIEAGERPWVTWGDLDEFMATGEDRVRKWAVCVDDKCGGVITPEIADKFRSFLEDLKKRPSPALVEHTGRFHDFDDSDD